VAPPLGERRRAVTRVRRLATDPRPHGCEKLPGEEKYRIRQGPYRVLFTTDDTACEVVIVRIAHRRDVYRWSKPPDGSRFCCGPRRPPPGRTVPMPDRRGLSAPFPG